MGVIAASDFARAIRNCPSGPELWIINLNLLQGSGWVQVPKARRKNWGLWRGGKCEAQKLGTFAVIAASPRGSKRCYRGR